MIMLLYIISLNQIHGIQEVILVNSLWILHLQQDGWGQV